MYPEEMQHARPTCHPAPTFYVQVCLREQSLWKLINIYPPSCLEIDFNGFDGRKATDGTFPWRLTRDLRFPFPHGNGGSRNDVKRNFIPPHNRASRAEMGSTLGMLKALGARKKVGLNA